MRRVGQWQHAAVCVAWKMRAPDWRGRANAEAGAVPPPPAPWPCPPPLLGLFPGPCPAPWLPGCSPGPARRLGCLGCSRCPARRLACPGRCRSRAVRRRRAVALSVALCVAAALSVALAAAGCSADATDAPPAPRRTPAAARTGAARPPVPRWSAWSGSSAVVGVVGSSSSATPDWRSLGGCGGRRARLRDPSASRSFLRFPAPFLRSQRHPMHLRRRTPPNDRAPTCAPPPVVAPVPVPLARRWDAPGCAGAPKVGGVEKLGACPPVLGPAATNDCPIGPEPTATPATTESAAATAATDAATLLCGRILGLVMLTGAAAAMVAGSECPNVRDVKTSSSDACSSNSPSWASIPPFSSTRNLSGGGSAVRKLSLRTPQQLPPHCHHISTASL